MENSNRNSNISNKKSKYINASAIFIDGEKSKPEEPQFSESSEQSKSEYRVFIKELSPLKASYHTNTKNSPPASGKIEILPLKMHFELSKGPIGVGRFGVVYKATNIKIKPVK